MTDLCQLEGRVRKWQLAYFGPKVGYFCHIFKDIDFKFVLPIIYIKIDSQTKLKVNQTQYDYLNHEKKPTKMSISQFAFFPKSSNFGYTFPNIFEPTSAKLLPITWKKWGHKCLEAKIKNQEFSPLTAAKRIIEKY